MRRLIILIAFITALAVPAQAIATEKEEVPQGAAGVHQYFRVVPTAEGEEAVPPEAEEQAPAPSQLPFSGEDVLLVVVAGGLLAGGGLALYRQVRQRS